jgi:hypothetical protein
MSKLHRLNNAKKGPNSRGGGVSFDAIFPAQYLGKIYRVVLGISPACTGDRPRNRTWDPAGWTASPRPGPKMCNFLL